ncbi:unnamed protein product [Schistosoma rodhaini]|uniref:Protein DPCD n=1 Tax=Schistosoma rodhaini TaxID=6188 RepID=A0AA85F950_9TREM|nr:unnamed protein product [Schistosoma rodhaini]CAH8490054.1 unnamed protein product [Schistosoma rodhaini]
MLHCQTRTPGILTSHQDIEDKQYERTQLQNMDTSAWIKKVKSAKATVIIEDGLQMVEEYDLSTHNLLGKKFRSKTVLGGDGQWEYEVGEPLRRENQFSEHLMESPQAPLFIRSDVPRAFQWRIRNLPYPLDVYRISVEDGNILLRTTNKKYYKKFNIPDMTRMGLPLNEKSISLTHANNTLLISYKKPDEILENEKLVRQYVSTLKPVEQQEDCKTS